MLNRILNLLWQAERNSIWLISIYYLICSLQDNFTTEPWCFNGFWWQIYFVDLQTENKWLFLLSRKPIFWLFLTLVQHTEWHYWHSSLVWYLSFKTRVKRKEGWSWHSWKSSYHEKSNFSMRLCCYDHIST